MTPLAACILIALSAGVLCLPPIRAALCLIVGALFLSQGAMLDLGGFSFAPTRVLGYLALARVMYRREIRFSTLGGIDKAMLILYSFTTLILLTRPEESPALRLAKLFDVVALYAAFRAFIKTPEDLKWLLGCMALLLVPYILMLGVERFTRHNFFDLVGAHGSIWTRDGKVRCFGSFRHPSLLGSLGACFLPLFVALFWTPALKTRAIIGIICCVGIVGFSNSGGPLSVVAVSVVGWMLWPLRNSMKQFRWALVVFIVVMGLAMESPIWYLLAKVSSITGGTGWHRSYLMDVAFRHLDQWWFSGMPISDTRGWFPYVIASTGGADITNQFIAFGLKGGLVSIFLFLVLLYRGFSVVGQARFRVRVWLGHEQDERLLWGLGVMLAAHISNWMGITYFDQFSDLWLMQFAGLVGISEFWLSYQPVEDDSSSNEDHQDERLASLRVLG